MDISSLAGLSPDVQEFVAMASIPSMLDSGTQQAKAQFYEAMSAKLIADSGGDASRLALSSAKLKELKETSKIEQDNLDREQSRRHADELHNALVREANARAVIAEAQATRMSQPRPQPRPAQPAQLQTPAPAAVVTP